MRDEERGFYFKYKITKTSGSPLDPNARYFVLRFDGDTEWGRHCRAVLNGLAGRIAHTYPKLAIDLLRETELERPKSYPPKKIQEEKMKLTESELYEMYVMTYGIVASGAGRLPGAMEICSKEKKVKKEEWRKILVVRALAAYDAILLPHVGEHALAGRLRTKSEVYKEVARLLEEESER